jgi:Protein of unknown function (DUF1579)
MKLSALTICSAALLLLSCNDGSKDTATKTDDASKTATSSDQTAVKKEAAPVATMPDSATAAKNMMEYGTPTDVHKMMAKWDGNWDGEVKFWMDPAAPPSVMNVKTVNKMVMNGLYQQATSTGSFSGMPFNGVSMLGYDNHRKVFTTTWVDNMSSGMMILEGTWDDATKSINLKGKMTDPMTRQQMDIREVMKIVDDNTQVMEQYLTHDGKESKSMEINFKRKK